MRSLLISLVLGASSLGLIGLTPSEAQAQRWRRDYYYAPSTSYYYPNYGYYGSYYTYPYSYYPNYDYSYYYSTPSYGYYSTPSYGYYSTPSYGYYYGTYPRNYGWYSGERHHRR